MKKRIKGKIMGLKRDQRRAMQKSLARALFLHQAITTTEGKAKFIVPFVEKLITRAKQSDINSRRYVNRYMSASVTKKLIEQIAPKYKDRSGGYTRIIKLGKRKSDSAKMAIVQLVE
jgi:large subunit ribosomal protein L17